MPVERGALVQIDPCSHGEFDPATDHSVNVVSMDRPEVKLSILVKVLNIFKAIFLV